jgi:hypothetical protein
MHGSNPSQPLHPSLSMQVPAGLADSPCQTDISLVLYLLGTSMAASLVSPRPPSLSLTAPKIAQFLCILNLLESTLVEVLMLRNLKLFRMNTYEKHRGWGSTPVAVLSHPVLIEVMKTIPEERPCVLTL